MQIRSTSDSKLSFYIYFLAVMMMCNLALTAQENGKSVQVEEFLHLGNFNVKMPAFHEQKNLDGDTFENADLIKFDYINLNALFPKAGKTITWKKQNYEWEKLKAAKNGFVFPEKKIEKNINQLAFLALWVETERWTKASLEVTSPQMFEVYAENKSVKTKTSEQGEDEDPEVTTIKLTLERGKHLLLFKLLKTATNDTDWKLKAELTRDTILPGTDLTLSLSPTENMSIDHLLNGTFVSGASVSPDGQLVMIRYSKTSPPGGDRKSWPEIRETESGKLVHTFHEADVSSMKWLPLSNAVSYETSEKGEGSSLWKFDLESMKLEKILLNVDEFGSYNWSPDESFIIYSVREKPENDEEDLKRYEGMPDRWPWWRTRSFLYRLDVNSGVSERLTYGHIGNSMQDIRPDGKKVLFSQNLPDFSERPYSKQLLMEMDLETYTVDTIWRKNFAGNCSYAPDGQHLLVTGSPAMFGNIGVNVTGNAIPNDYDTQAYIYDLVSGDVDPITFNFNPSIEQSEWSGYDPNIIYFLASDKTYKKIFSYDLNTRYFEEVPTGFDVVNSMSLAENYPIAVCTGSGISTPPYAVALDLTDGSFTTLANPRQETFKNVEFGETAEWNFTNRNGVEIEGRVYFPPDFDKKKKYPLIVYYYGGTSPTERSFGGRYPKNLFASQGYVVYNLQPSGATGYGQDFSAAHVNNWGITVADEIIDGTKKFIKDHNFIDGEKVGCIGASYGGFMTMLLQTRTDIFSAAISHAGISSIASYWGEGYWGYLYSSVASANSFPWNNKKLYIDQSALFNADKINTPLLLLHGSVDTNVPPGESIQLYTALKLLGKPVELIEVKNQNHHILDYEKRIKWQKTIFAWFDKWMKDQPEWWNELYPERNL